MKYLYNVFFLAAAMFIVGTPPVSAADTHAPEIKVFEAKKKGAKITEQNFFLGFDQSYTNGATVAVCDLDNNGMSEIVLGAGQGAAPEVKVFSRKGKLKASFMAYDASVTSGLHVACGKLQGKKSAAQIVVGPGRGAGPQVKVFDMQGNLQTSFMAYNEGFHGGVSVAVGKVDKKFQGQQIITGAGPGATAHVRVFDKNGTFTGQDFHPFADDYDGGVSVAVANVDGGKKAEIVMGQYIFGGLVKVYKNNSAKQIVGEFKPYGDDFQGGVMVANVKDIDKDGVHELVTVPRQGGSPHVKIVEGHGETINDDLFAYDKEFRGGTAIAAGNVDGDSKKEIVTVPLKKYADGRMDLGSKYIEVDLSEQTLYAYHNGVKEHEYLISSGLPGYETPQGITEVSAKLPVHDYKWEYGPNDSRNYDIKDVQSNLRFRRHYYIHSAFWHENFGNPMSHGCVNMDEPDAAVIYDWADVGTKVWIHE